MTRRSGPPPTRRGLDFGECASALQKSIRRGDEEQALRFAVELEESGYGAYVWRRLFVITSEDVGLAEPHLPATIYALHGIAEHLRKKAAPGQRPWRLMLCHAVLMIARARKSRIVDHALIWASREDDPLEVPAVALDRHTMRGRKMGRGHQQFWEEGTLLFDPRSGELSHAPHLPDAYRERAVALRGGPGAWTSDGPDVWTTEPAQNSHPGDLGQLPFESGEDR
jgi:hypothetical protein